MSFRTIEWRDDTVIMIDQTRLPGEEIYTTYTDFQSVAEAIKGMIPLGRRGDPAELAHAVLFLLDERAAYVTGSVVTVDGGISMGA